MLLVRVCEHETSADGDRLYEAAGIFVVYSSEKYQITVGDAAERSSQTKRLLRCWFVVSGWTDDVLGM